MKYTSSIVSRITRYARSTVVPCPSTEISRKSEASTAWVRMATWGVCQRGCTLPNAGGK